MTTMVEEPSISMERRGDPIPDVDVSLCGKYKYYDSKLKKCVPLPKEGTVAGNTTTTATSELMNQTEPIDNDSTTGDLVIREEGAPSGPCIVIREEGTPSGPGHSQSPPPQPNQPSPSPKPC